MKTKCLRCKGTGEDPNDHITEPCMECKGAGFINFESLEEKEIRLTRQKYE